MVKPKYILTNSEILPEVLNLLEQCLRRHERNILTMNYIDLEDERKLLLARARHAGMKQLVADFIKHVDESKKL